MTLQQQVQQQLDSTGMSIRDLAKQAGLGKSTVALVVSGRSNPSIRTRRKLQAAIRDYKPQTLDATVEQLAEQCIDSDLTHVRDDALECGKQRRIAALEAGVSVVREQRNKLGFACEELTADLETEKRNFAALEQVHEQREQHLKSCENALIEADQKLNDANTAWVSLNTQHGTTTQQLRDANAEIKRLTALSETQAASWKAACVQAEQLQKQLDHCQQAQFKSLRAAYNQQVDDEREMLAQIDTLFVERENAATLHDQQIMCLRVRCFALVCAIVPLIVSGLVVWGGV